jgi:hypothetical protein
MLLPSAETWIKPELLKSDSKDLWDIFADRLACGLDVWGSKLRFEEF